MTRKKLLKSLDEPEIFFAGNKVRLDEVTTKKNNMNPLLSAATTLLALFAWIDSVVEPVNVLQLRNQVIKEIKSFVAKLKTHYSNETILAACYCLCTAIDEAILKTTWGIKSVWAEKGLLSIFYQETLGGQRFYMVLDKMSENPEKNLDILELLYTLLNLGFEGKYYNQKSIRDVLRQKLFEIILSHRPHFKPNFFYQTDAKQNKYFSWKPFLPRWLIYLLAGLLLIVVWSKLNIQTLQEAKPLIMQLETFYQK